MLKRSSLDDMLSPVIPRLMFPRKGILISITVILVALTVYGYVCYNLVPGVHHFADQVAKKVVTYSSCDHRDDC